MYNPPGFSLHYNTGVHGHHVAQKIVHSYCAATATFQTDSLNPILSNGWLDSSVKYATVEFKYLLIYLIVNVYQLIYDICNPFSKY